MNDSSRREVTRGAQLLGWASVGIGLTELAAPHLVENMLGIDESPQQQGILRVLGVRELMHGVSLIAEEHSIKQRQVALWSRVLGDVLDNVLLGVAAIKTRRPLRLAAVAGAVAAIGLADGYLAVKSLRV